MGTDELYSKCCQDLGWTYEKKKGKRQGERGKKKAGRKRLRARKRDGGKARDKAKK